MRTNLKVLCKITEESDLYLINGAIHDLYIDIDDIQYDSKSNILKIPFWKDESRNLYSSSITGAIMSVFFIPILRDIFFGTKSQSSR
jgi:hypothetical protein